MSASNKIQYEMISQIRLNESKEKGILTNDVTLKAYRKHVCDFCDWAKDLGMRRMHEIGKQGYTPVTLVQKYADELVAKGLKPTTVHTYIAPVCKGFGIGMEQINKPRRLSADIVKNTKLKQNKVGQRQVDDPRYARILRLAEIVTVRPQALVRLSANNLKIDENGDNIIEIRDKGGKKSIQLLLPHEATLVREILSKDAAGNPLKPGERPFSKKDLGQIAYSAYRIKRAQNLVTHFDRQFNAWRDMPRKTAAQRRLRDKAKATADALKKEWIDKIVEKYRKKHPNETQVAKYRRQLENPSPICIRGGNRERAIKLGRPTQYDRVAVRIVSVYALSHWVDETTIRNYLTK